MDFAIKIEGLRPVERRLYKLSVAFGDLFPLMEQLGTLLENSTRRRFETETSPEGVPWKISERVNYEGGKTLTKDGHLRDSLTHLATPASVEVGTNIIYGRIHQLGGVIKPVSADALVFTLPDGKTVIHAQSVIIPARPYLGISDEDLIGIERVVDRYEEAIAA